MRGSRALTRLVEWCKLPCNFGCVWEAIITDRSVPMLGEMVQGPPVTRRARWRAARVLVLSLAVGFVLVASVTLAPLGRASTPAAGNLRASLADSDLGKSPPYLQQLAMVDDAALNAILTFGGLSPYVGSTDWTLTYEDGSWTNLTPDLSRLPPPRYGAAMAYDPIDQEAVLFGGCLTSSCYPALNDTWIFANDTWTELSGPGPPARGFAAMTWDAASDYVILFGGKAGTAESTIDYYNDTWTFIHNRWTNLTGEESGPRPTAVSAASLTSTPSTGPVLFGGASAQGLVGDTWTFAGGNWTNVTSSSGPSPRQAAAFAGNPADGIDYLFGGYAAGAYYSDTWSYSGGIWTRLPTSGPPGTFGAGFAWDPSSSRLILYGGAISQDGSTGTTDAFWTFSGTSWSLVNPPPPIPFPWIALLPVLFFAVVLPVEIVLIRRRRRRRENELSQLTPEPSPGSVRWYPTNPPNLVDRAARRQALLMLGIFVPFGLFTSFVFVATGLNLVAVILLAFVWAVFLGMPFLIYRTARRTWTRSLGLFEGGIIVQSADRTRRIPWEYVQPPIQVLRGPWVVFRYSLPGKPSSTAVGGAFSTTREQARIILTTPRAAGWNVPPPVRAALGLEPAPFAPLPSPPIQSPPPPPPTYQAPGGPTLPYIPPPPPPAAPPSVASGPMPTSTVAQLRRCPNCNGLTSMRTRYCPNCGQALR